MRATLLLASVLALGVASNACVEETVVPAQAKTKKKKKSPGSENENGEHGSNAPGDVDGTTEAPDEGEVLASATWATGTALSTTSTIGEGATITIEPGAVINVGADVALTVRGTLKIAAGTNHAKLTGAAWQGIIVAEGGKLEADGLEIIGAKGGIWTQAGNAPSTFKNGVLEASSPFKMEAGSNLTVDHSSVKTSNGGSAIAGTFVANYMKYDKGTGGGLTLNDPAGTMTITNSTLTGGGGGDYVISTKGKKVTVTRTSISGSHCAFHFSGSGTDAGTASFLIERVDVRNNGVGGMLYNSGAGPNEVKTSNFTANNEYDISFGSNGNGPITFSNTFGTIPDETNVTQTARAGALHPPADVGPLAE